MTAPTLADQYAGAEALFRPLAAQLPGLLSALDSQLTARHIEQTLLGPGGRVHRLTPSALWYQSDGSCSFRYRAAVSVGSSEVTEHTILARVHPSDEVVGAGPASDVHRLVPPTDPPFPWQRWATTHPARGVTLYVFPADPASPTLAQALDLTALHGENWPSEKAVPVSVELVHHPRRGAAVLRYDVRPTDSSPASSSGHLYAKVYPDPATGERVQRFLRSWVGPAQVRIPVSLGYTPTLNLLLTAALPGQPVLPDILRSAARASSDPPAALTHASAHDAVRSTGRALAALHHTRQATAPVHTLRQFRQDLDLELDLVQQLWPQTADRIRSSWDRVETETESEGAHVLCHGDFTPSQILLVGHTVSGIVDLDTACWGESAMDLGRFIAHLDLLITKERGQSAEPLREQLGHSFLAGYGDAVGAAAIDQQLQRRIALFRSASLVLTALHACRQLKERRMNLALSLLDTANNRMERTTS